VASRWRTFWWLFQRSLILAYEDDCLGIAKGAAYSALFSFFPLLTATAIVLVQARAESISNFISRLLSHLVPPGTEELVLENFRANGAKPVSLLVIATLVSIWAASRMMTSLMDGFEAAYHIPTGRSFLRHQGVAILLVFACALPAMAATGLVISGSRAEQLVLRWLGVIQAGQDVRAGVALVARLGRYAIAIGTNVAVAATLYHLGPNRPQKWRLVLPGAWVSTLLWLASTLGFAWYVRNIAGYNVLYGSIAAVIALLVWMYLLAAIALIGCEFNAEWERILGERG
jgi:membrane protein